MHRSLKALVVVCAIAISSLLAPNRADAQSIGWNVIRPTACFQSIAANPSGQFVYTFYVYTSTYTVTITDPATISGLMPLCYNASAFWGYFNGSPVWSMFYITPGMK